MRKKKVQDSTSELLQMLEAAAKNQEFNIAIDMRELQKQYNKLRVKDFKKYLTTLVDKYTTSEYATVHEVLIKLCREGNVSAIRLYHEMNKESSSGGEEVTIIDDI